MYNSRAHEERVEAWVKGGKVWMEERGGGNEIIIIFSQYHNYYSLK